MIKKLCFIFILAALLMSLFPSGVFAVAEGSLLMDTSDILQDLEGSSWNGKTFDINNYPASSTKDAELIYLAEYCYSDINLENYALYVYVYNPKQLDFDTDNSGNKLQLATVFDDSGNATDYGKFSLHFCTKTNDKVFYKFRVVEDMQIIRDMACSYGRKYCVSGIELVTEGESTATDYFALSNSKKGAVYTYSGFAPGYGSLDEPLFCSVDETDIIELNVTSTYYRTGVSDLGVGYQNQVNSVYFAVDNYYFNTYGYLEKIKAVWYEYKLKNMIVTSDRVVYDNLYANLGRILSSYDSTVYSIYNNLYAYNASPQLSSGYDIDYLSNVFYSANLNDGVKSDVIKNHVFSYDKSNHSNFLVNVKNGKLTEDLFEYHADEGRFRGLNSKTISLTDTFDLDSYASNHNWLDKFLNFGFDWSRLDEDHPGVTPIYELKQSDLLGSDVDVAYNLLVNVSDVSILKSAYASAFAQNKKIILFRFADTQYFSSPVGVVKKKFFTSNDVDYNSTYIASETIFLDFDVLHLTFNNDGVQRVISAVSSPIDIISDITAPIVSDSTSLLDWLKQVGKYIFIAILVLIVLVFFGPYLLRFVVWVISLPFKLIGAIYNSFKTKEHKRL